MRSSFALLDIFDDIHICHQDALQSKNRAHYHDPLCESKRSNNWVHQQQRMPDQGTSAAGGSHQ